MKIFGLTGGIGSGKSTVAKLFEELGVPCLDADTIARKLRQPGEAGYDLILSRFGTTDRGRLREILSQDPVAKKDLEAILHPLIKEASDRELKNLATANPQAPFLLYEATLLIEAGRTQDFDGVILVTAPQDERMKRVGLRDQTTSEATLRMIQSQMIDEERKAHATHVIENHGSLEDLRGQVKRVFEGIIRGL